MKWYFTSRLNRSYHEELEKLLFFNPAQARVISDILKTVERYGAPKIVAAEDRLLVTTDSSAPVQTLFALEDREPQPSLVGIVVYTREDDILPVLYFAVDEGHADRSTRTAERLFLRMVDELRRIARRIKGVSSLSFLIGGEARRISVRA